MTILDRARGRIVDGVPRWVVWCAYAPTFVVLPSSIWRILAFAWHAPLVESGPPANSPGPALFEGVWYVVTLSVVSELLTFLTVGLVASWGEVMPRWIPGLGGRRIPVLAAAIPAAVGATICTVLWPYVLTMLLLGRTVDGTSGVGLHLSGWQEVGFWIAYAPLVAWGPLVWIVTVQYYRRRTSAI